MRGSPVYQAHKIFSESGINKIGESKHEAKAIARENIATGSSGSQSRSATWHEIGKQLGVHSYATADNYRDVWRYTLQYARENFGIRDIEKLTPEAVSAYLESKIDAGVKHATFMLYAAAVEKLESALNMYAEKNKTDKTYNFSAAIRPMRLQAHEKLEKFEGSRAYWDPKKIIENMKENEYKIVARLQTEAGLRIKETNMISKLQLLPDNWLEVHGKGGKIRTVQLPADLHRQLKNEINSSNNYIFSYNQNSYRTALRHAATTAGEVYTGKSTHGLRWNYARENFQKTASKTGSPTFAHAKTSSDMGHNRASTTEHYLG